MTIYRWVHSVGISHTHLTLPSKVGTTIGLIRCVFSSYNSLYINSHIRPPPSTVLSFKQSCLVKGT